MDHKKQEVRPGVVLFREGSRWKWARQHPHCSKCGLVSSPHRAKGLCSRCYFRDIDKKPRRKYVHKKSKKKWFEKNKDREEFRIKNAARSRRYWRDNKEKILDRRKFLRSLKKNKGAEIAVGQIRVRCPWSEIPLNYANEFLRWRKKLFEYAKYIKKT